MPCYKLLSNILSFMTGPEDISFSLQKKEITRKHRQECISAVEGILGEDPVISGDLIFINFFALVTFEQGFCVFL